MPLNSLVLAAFGLVLSTMVYPQDSQKWIHEDYDIHKFNKKAISLQPFHSNITQKHINRVLVVDARADTMPIGFMQQKDIHNRVFLVLAKGVAGATEEFVNHYFSLSPEDSADQVIMILKKLWLTDALEPTHVESNDKLRDSLDTWTSGIIVKIEFYLHRKSDYYPLYQYDTIYSKPLKIAEAGQEFLQQAIQFSLSRLTHLDEKWPVVTTRKLSWEEIKKHNDQRFDIPILKDTALNAGVYQSFEEFKNNAPSQKEFEVRKGKFNDMVYVMQPNGKELPERNIWGYCDGKKIFVKSVDNFFLLQRQGNAFYIYGAKVLNKMHGRKSFVDGNLNGNGAVDPGSAANMYVPGEANLVLSQIPAKTLKMHLKPFQLDWDDGQLH